MLISLTININSVSETETETETERVTLVVIYCIYRYSFVENADDKNAFTKLNGMNTGNCCESLSGKRAT